MIILFSLPDKTNESNGRRSPGSEESDEGGDLQGTYEPSAPDEKSGREKARNGGVLSKGGVPSKGDVLPEDGTLSDYLLSKLFSGDRKNSCRTRPNELRLKKVYPEDWMSDEVGTLDDLVRAGRREMEKERHLDDRTGSDRIMFKAPNATRDRAPKACPMITNDSDQVGELSAESNMVGSANLKLVYEVEYQAPC